MQLKSFPATAALVVLTGAAALAQDLPDLSSASSDAVSALSDAAESKLLIADLIGANVSDPSGNTVGTVDDLVAIPGGRIVAALIKPSDGGDLVPVPFKAVKVSQTADKASAALPDTLGAMRDSSAVQKLSDALGSLADGSVD